SLPCLYGLSRPVLLPQAASFPALSQPIRDTTMPGMHSPDDRITFLARTNFHGYSRLFGIRQADRRTHMYLIGKTGTGKSTLLETLIAQDMKAGQGLALLDPHGDLVQKVLTQVPKERRADLVYFDAPDRQRPLSFNPLERVAPARRAFAASAIVEVF